MVVENKKRQIDYKRELENASKGMIMIHDPKRLMKLIVRIIVSKVQIKHAGMILYEPLKDTYVLAISRGERGLKIPAGFARFGKDHPIIQLFTQEEYRSLTINRTTILNNDLNKLIWHETILNGKHGNGNTELLHRVGDQMKMLNTMACVPAFYRDKLLAVLLLGEKRDGSVFEKVELDFFEALASDVAMAIRNAQLFEALKRESEKNHDLFIRTTIVLGSTIEAKDKYTHGHTERVTNYSMAIAHRMAANGSVNFDESFFQSLYVGGMLHDIGKIGVPESILNKTEALTPDELKIMHKHTIYGAEILKPLSELKDSIDGVKYHHERYDGKGYPEGLKGEGIPIIAAIIAVADTFDAMTTDRPYRKGLSRVEAIAEIQKQSGVQFNPKVVQAIVELFGNREI